MHLDLYILTHILIVLSYTPDVSDICLRFGARPGKGSLLSIPSERGVTCLSSTEATKANGAHAGNSAFALLPGSNPAFISLVCTYTVQQYTLRYYRFLSVPDDSQFDWKFPAFAASPIIYRCLSLLASDRLVIV